MKEFKIAVLSDLHLGNKRNKTEDIIYNLRRAFPDTQETAELDMIVLCGDVFDRLLDYPDEDVTHINIWIYEFLYLCSKNNTVVRVLEGTPSHDRFQSEAFNTIKYISKLDVDLKYFKILDIEYIERFDKTFLYIPDEWEVTTDITLNDFKNALKAKNLSQVDFAFMHGNFDYQLPTHLNKIPRHNSDEYLKLVKHYIFIGHIHVFSFKDRIIAQGSFDRLSHGEENPKGHVRAVITETDQEFFFVENKLARLYKTYKCYKFSLEETLEYLRKKVAKLPTKSCVRVEAKHDHPIFSNMNRLSVMYPTIVWSKLSKNNEEEETAVIDDTVEEYIQITINKENIVSLLMARINNLGVDSSISSKSQTLLTELI